MGVVRRSLQTEIQQEESRKENSLLLQTELPVKTVTSLPSGFLPYPEGSEITYVPYTFGELLQFSESNVSRVDQFDFILKGISTKGFDKVHLTYFDYLYIAVLRKLSSFKDDTFVLEFECQYCSHVNKSNEKLTSLEFDELKIPSVPVVIKDDLGNQLHFMPLTIKNLMDIEKKKKLGDRLSMFAISVANMPFEEAYNTIEKASMELLRAISYLNDAFKFGIKNIERVCSNPSCGKVNILDMSEPEAFIYPFRDVDELIGDRISFGL